MYSSRYVYSCLKPHLETIANLVTNEETYKEVEKDLLEMVGKYNMKQAKKEQSQQEGGNIGTDDIVSLPTQCHQLAAPAEEEEEEVKLTWVKSLRSQWMTLTETFVGRQQQPQPQGSEQHITGDLNNI